MRKKRNEEVRAEGAVDLPPTKFTKETKKNEPRLGEFEPGEEILDG